MTSPDLQKFCKLILAVVENDRVRPPWFWSGFGLCSNAQNYDNHYGTDVLHQIRFLTDFEIYPFNGLGFADYHDEKRMGKTYENEQRLAFLRKHAGEE